MIYLLLNERDLIVAITGVKPVWGLIDEEHEIYAWQMGNNNICGLESWEVIELNKEELPDFVHENAYYYKDGEFKEDEDITIFARLYSEVKAENEELLKKIAEFKSAEDAFLAAKVALNQAITTMKTTNEALKLRMDSQDEIVASMLLSQIGTGEEGLPGLDALLNMDEPLTE